jgi:hypothetical protein
VGVVDAIDVADGSHVTRDLNRATLARQYLLERAPVPVIDAA